MHFGNYIKELRVKAGLSQRDLEKLSGISNAEISRIETGNRQNPSPLAIRAIAPHLGVSIECLMQKAGYCSVDIFVQQAERIYKKDSELIGIFDKIVDSNSDENINIIKKILSCFS
jgi:HTH-type transcriptional regulator, competence development regulator